MTIARPAPLARVLVATDFSEASARGLAWGADLARRHGAELHLVHGIAWTAALPAAEEGAFLDLRNEVSRQVLGRLEELAASVDAGTDVRCHADFGQPSEVVLAVAKEIEADVVVVGTRGHGPLRALWIGSTAARIVQRSRCDVLSVHPDDPGLPTTEEPCFLVPLDLAPGAERVPLEAARVFGVAPERTTLRLIHAFPFPAQLESYGLGTQAIAVRYREEERRALEARLESLARGLRDDGWRVETRLVDGSPAAVVLEEAEAWGADAIAMDTHGRTGFGHLVLGSTAERVVQRARCPVLTLRRVGKEAASG